MSVMMLRLCAIVALLLLPLSVNAKPLNVFAAASLRNVLTQIGAQFKAKTGNDVVLTVASSSAIARQIEQGAPADIFISANEQWMDYLQKENLIAAGSRVDLLSNALVLIGDKDDPNNYTINKDFDLSAALNGGRLAIGATKSVPAGEYAKAALVHLDLWGSIKSQLAEAENVRAALLLVSRGEAPLGIVYATDAKIDDGVKVLCTFPKASYPQITYSAAIVDGAQSEDATAFMRFLKSADAAKIFSGAGFIPLPQANN